ncbi:YdcF family protein [Alicyclobacillus sendaiensis]|uniref:YdcF family protein n=1 Tax=Alicyclobacillus sendaiensis PA2 TaxID=3029425 RepID=A0ABT6Y1U2_ALISE|nr:YdcF family protein [Alicyclobacillus sendaiensis]MDI9261002.1 YdcF family protein [Alicyclobacillus sendaiensis PA2]
MLWMVKLAESLALPPGLFATLTLLLAVLLARHRRGFALALAAVSLAFAAACTPAVGDLLLAPLERAYAPPARPSGDAIVVLGAGFSAATPDFADPGLDTGTLYGDSGERVLAAAALYRELHLPIVLSGGPLIRANGKSYAFALIAARDLAALGVPRRDMYVDPTSRTTEENAEHTALILRRLHRMHPILVASAAQMARAVMDFRRVELVVTPYPVGYTVSEVPTPLAYALLPSETGLDETAAALHEDLGILAARLHLHG